jgi:hypothetical protein
MVGLVVGLVFPTLAAYALVAYCDRNARSGIATFFLRICLAIGLGVGLSSCSYFLWLFFVGAPGKTYPICEFIACATIALFALVRQRLSAARRLSLSCGEGVELRIHVPHAAQIGAVLDGPPIGHWQGLLFFAYPCALFLAVLGAVGKYWKSPLGDWDTWAFWNQRARFFFRAGDQWRQAFSPEFVHIDYPLLLPNSNARLWSWLGTEHSWVPWLLGSLFTFATVGILTAGVCRLRSQSQGLLAGLVLLGMVAFLQRGALQYADIPLAFFILSAVLLLALYDASEQPRRELLVLSGVMAGLAAWTKNEGLLVLIALPVARSAAVWRRDGTKRMLGDLLCWSAGVLPALVVIVIQKSCLAGRNELINDQSLDVLFTKLCDPWRYVYIAQAFLVYTIRIARPFAIVLPLCCLLLGAAKHSSRGVRGLPTASVMLLLMLAGYFFVYLTTPCELHWHLSTSTDRLLLHVLPLCLLIVFLRVATPEEVLAKESTAEGKGLLTTPHSSVRLSPKSLHTVGQE